MLQRQKVAKECRVAVSPFSVDTVMHLTKRSARVAVGKRIHIAANTFNVYSSRELAFDKRETLFILSIP